MPINRGKQFEIKFAENWKSTMPDSSIDRLKDQMSGYKGTSKNVCDFICYLYPNIFYLEIKSHAGASIPFVNITQYDNLKKKVGIKGVRSGVILWLYDKDKVYYIPTSTITQMKNDGEKSVGLRHIGKYNMIEIPSIKKRVFMDSDYSILKTLKEGE